MIVSARGGNDIYLAPSKDAQYRGASEMHGGS
jgi:hypothetical protein